MHPKVRLVVLNFNGGDDVLHCLSSLESLEWPEDDLEIVVVDNASTDGSPERIVDEHPSVELIRNPVNAGFSANNLAFTDLDDIDFVGLVNPDAWVAPDWLAHLAGAFDGRPTMGAACPRILLADRFVDVRVRAELPATIADVTIDGVSRISACGRAWRLVGDNPRHDGAGRWVLERASFSLPVSRSVDVVDVAVVLEGRGPVDVDTSDPYDVVNNTGVVLHDDLYASDRGLGRREADYRPTEDVQAWTGGGVLLRAEYLADVGCFDDSFFLYYEDVDLSLRGRRRGWTYRYVHDAVMWHHHSASSTEGSTFFRFHNERSRLLMIAKNTDLATTAKSFGRFAVATLGYARADALRPALAGDRPDFGTVRMRLRALASALWELARSARR